ncbi:TetR/AcrR family transcriptional regulator [Solimonas marina]|uniref:TetR/AcrR family transcriptional regulator n=1 Tax=Solimonas marina TaxID=2714601 RepID=A0A969WAW3_9GAMM|nr:TetR/AcrR family transcriptional regulator [Solimonas marina]NKF22774.1 TetR/AcrR family transcriptional regulator [Solimonas marina]
MGTKERRLRDFAEREQRFLTAARELIVQDGLLNLQMSRVAEKCDYAVGTLYQHFVSKEDLLLALATDQSQGRVQMFERVRDWKASSRDRMLGFALADMMLARRCPDHFRLLQFTFTEVVWGAAPEARRQACMDMHRPLRQATLDVIDDALRSGELQARGLSIEQICLAPWALAVGLHAIVHHEGLLEQYSIREPYQLMLRHLSDLLNGMDWKPLADTSDTAAYDELAARFSREVMNEDLDL